MGRLKGAPVETRRSVCINADFGKGRPCGNHPKIRAFCPGCFTPFSPRLPNSAPQITFLAIRGGFRIVLCLVPSEWTCLEGVRRCVIWGWALGFLKVHAIPS